MRLEQKYAWEQIDPQPAPVVEGVGVRRFLSGETMTVARFEFTRGTVLASHRHENEQFSLVLEGTMEFQIEGRDAPLIAQAGEIVCLRPQVLHGARAVTNAVVLDVFSPPRADWQSN
ncbi:MAG: cupin domain-containing protein [Cytophagales bacterium]|nr:cupin domain-containing protein [Armatimonadota bacterium]